MTDGEKAREHYELARAYEARKQHLIRLQSDEYYEARRASLKSRLDGVQELLDKLSFKLYEMEQDKQHLSKHIDDAQSKIDEHRRAYIMLSRAAEIERFRRLQERIERLSEDVGDQS